MVRRDPIFVAWAAGLALAVFVYLMGPDRFLFRLADTFHVMIWQISEAIAAFSASAIDAVRALAIGLYVTFVALSVAVLRRGGAAKGSLIVVTLLFLVLIGDAGRFDTTRWVLGLALAAAGAMVMTGRLRQVPARP